MCFQTLINIIVEIKFNILSYIIKNIMVYFFLHFHSKVIKLKIFMRIQLQYISLFITFFKKICYDLKLKRYQNQNFKNVLRIVLQD